MSKTALPYDIICLIIEQAYANISEFSPPSHTTTLISLSLLSHGSCSYANRYIWRCISLISSRHMFTQTEIQGRCNLLLKDDQRRKHVRELRIIFGETIDFDSYEVPDGRLPQASRLGSAEGRNRASMFRLVAETIYACSSTLESLSIFGPNSADLDDMACALGYQWLHSLHPLDFGRYDSLVSKVTLNPSAKIVSLHRPPAAMFTNLKAFSSVLAPFKNRDLSYFLTYACPNVTRWSTTGYGAGDCTRSLPLLVFPLLTTFEGVSRNIEAVISTRPVHDISIIHHIDTYYHLERLVLGLMRSLVDVTRLSLNVSITEISFRDEDDTAVVPDFMLENLNYPRERRLLDSLARATPHLRYLELFTHGDYVRNDYRAENGALLAKWLLELKELEEFEWWDARADDWVEEFTREISERTRRCKAGVEALALKRVAFNSKEIPLHLDA